MKIKAIIFDLDGVLTDTAEYHYLAWKALADRLNLKFDRQDNERLKGVSRLQSLEIILEMNGKEQEFSLDEKEKIAEEKNREYVALISQVTPRDILPGIEKFLKDAKEKNLLLAVASASKNAQTVLNGLKITEKFDYIADAKKIKKTKPDPEVFLDCASSLGVKPCECVGVEDAQAGIEAIKAAGMFAVGIHVNTDKIRPDMELMSTKELNIDRILTAAEE